MNPFSPLVSYSAGGSLNDHNISVPFVFITNVYPALPDAQTARQVNMCGSPGSNDCRVCALTRHPFTAQYSELAVAMNPHNVAIAEARPYYPEEHPNSDVQGSHPGLLAADESNPTARPYYPEEHPNSDMQGSYPGLLPAEESNSTARPFTKKKRPRGRRSSARTQERVQCAFCKKNNERKSFYTAHALKDDDGNVQCPVLRSHSCEICGATGDKAHTKSHCPTSGENTISHALAFKMSPHDSAGHLRKPFRK